MATITIKIDSDILAREVLSSMGYLCLDEYEYEDEPPVEQPTEPDTGEIEPSGDL